MSLITLVDERLPLNRKERFFTGTVFPMIVACDDFAHLGRVLDLVGAPRGLVRAHPDETNVEFFTEYGFLESLVGDIKDRFTILPAARDTPDVLIYVDGEPGLLIGVEAKMYDNPTPADLNRQLASQASILESMASGLPDDVAVHHVALVPAQLADSVGALDAPTVTWEELIDTYADVAPAYWIEMLRLALSRYGDLVSTYAPGGQNKDAKVRGLALFSQHFLKPEFTWMGRQGGLDGTALATDIATGSWKTFNYEARREPLPDNPNWFPVEDFVARVQEVVQPDAQVIDTSDMAAWIAEWTECDGATVEKVLQLELEWMAAVGIVDAEAIEFQYYQPEDLAGQPAIVDVDRLARDAEILLDVPEDLATEIYAAELVFLETRGLVSPE